MVARYEFGEYIDLIWDGGRDAEYVRGHVSRKVFFERMEEQGVEIPEDAPLAHRYGRWSCDANSECDHVLAVYNEHGPWRFPITEWSLLRSSHDHPPPTIPPTAIRPRRQQCLCCSGCAGHAEGCMVQNCFMERLYQPELMTTLHRGS